MIPATTDKINIPHQVLYHVRFESPEMLFLLSFMFVLFLETIPLSKPEIELSSTVISLLFSIWIPVVFFIARLPLLDDNA